MLARPELLLPLAFSLSGLMIVVALVLLRVSGRQRQAYRSSVGIGVRTDVAQRPSRGVPRKRQARMYA
jgi:hypothetical protein